MNKLYIYTFYRFITIGNKDKIKKQIDAVLSSKNLKGTILIANEGINGSISGEKFQIIDFLKFLRSIINVRNLNIKVNTTKNHLFIINLSISLIPVLFIRMIINTLKMNVY